MIQQQVALLEFDREKRAKFSPENFGKRKCLPKKCVISFSKTSTDAVAKRYGAEVRTEFWSCTANLPVYVLVYGGEEIALVCGFLGAAGAAAQIEELIAMGVEKFVVCGAAGVLTELPLGAFVVPDSAVRDEGTSFHYAPSSYEIKADQEAVQSVVHTLEREKIPYQLGKTWTTDGLYRETDEKIALRRSQGCLTVEMEASALMAVAQFRGVRLAQILYGGDDLSGEIYDHRDFFAQHDIRQTLVEISLKCVKDL